MDELSNYPRSHKVIRQLYALWEPQCTESYRKSASPYIRESKSPNCNYRCSTVLKFRAVETAIETVHILQKPKTKQSGNNSRS